MSSQTDRAFAVFVVKQLRTAGFQALWAGGCVRDVLMGIEPSDYDVATSATPEQVRRLFGGRHTIPVGVSFGVIVVLSEDRLAQQIEVTTFRSDAAYSDGRHPDFVIFSTAEEDARRRDFTINGMFYDPLEDQLIDYVGGRDDIERGLIRAIGVADERLAEDKLRMLRAVRFSARFGFRLDSATRDAIARHAAEISMVSGERIAGELQRTLETARAGWSVVNWRQTGLLRGILPELDQAWEERGARALAMLEGALSCATESCLTWQVRLAALLWGGLDSYLERDAALDGIRGRLKLANEETAEIRFALRTQSILQDAESKPWSQVQSQLIKPHASAGFALLCARQAAGEVRSETLAWLQERLSWTAERLDPPPLLSGKDLIEFGLRPGPTFGNLLNTLRSMQLDGQLSDRKAAFEFVTDYLAE